MALAAPEPPPPAPSAHRSRTNAPVAFESLPPATPSRRENKCTISWVEARHWRIEFMKQVLPRLARPFALRDREAAEGDGGPTRVLADKEAERESEDEEAEEGMHAVRSDLLRRRCSCGSSSSLLAGSIALRTDVMSYADGGDVAGGSPRCPVPWRCSSLETVALRLLAAAAAASSLLELVLYIPPQDMCPSWP